MITHLSPKVKVLLLSLKFFNWLLKKGDRKCLFTHRRWNRFHTLGYSLVKELETHFIDYLLIQDDGKNLFPKRLLCLLGRRVIPLL